MIMSGRVSVIIPTSQRAHLVGRAIDAALGQTYEDVEKLWTVGGSAFSSELMMTCIRRGWKRVEIPVNYAQRMGTSKITGRFSKAFKLGLGMVWLIFVYRFKPIKRHTG